MGDDYPTIHAVLQWFLSGEIDPGDLEGYAWEMRLHGTANTTAYPAADWLLIVAANAETSQFFGGGAAPSFEQLQDNIRRLIACHKAVAA